MYAQESCSISMSKLLLVLASSLGILRSWCVVNDISIDFTPYPFKIWWSTSTLTKAYYPDPVCDSSAHYVHTSKTYVDPL